MNTNDILENYVRCKVLYEMAHSLHDRICHDEAASKEVINASFEMTQAVNKLMSEINYDAN